MSDEIRPGRAGSGQTAGGETERLKAELAEIRHDLKNPISAILGYSEMLLEDMGLEGQEEYAGDLQRIHTAAEMLLELVDNLLVVEMFERDEQDVAPEPPQAPLERAARQRYISTTQGRLLIVDDNESNRDMLARRLERQGHTIAVAVNGKQALRLLAEQPVDLVLLDVMMPEMDGYETLQRIKADPALHHIPVLMLSALNQLDSVVQCIEMGADDYLTKPYNPVLLRARIDASLEKKRMRDGEIAYLRDVARVTNAAAALEASTFEPQLLEPVTERVDELGQLARVFMQMGREVLAREQRLRQQLQQLRIEIDQNRKESQVAEITETDYFQTLQKRAKALRKKPK